VIGDKTASVEVTDATQRLAERTIVAGKKKASELEDGLKGATAKQVPEKIAQAARDVVWKKNDAPWSGFDSFGRDAARMYYEVNHKKGRPNFISAEFQDCFGHALIEILRRPKGEPDLLAITHGLRELNEELKGREIVSAFAFAPVDDVELSSMFLAAGFRKTGLLARGACVENKRTDAILWTRKLADPSGGEGSEEGFDE
jgi:hypothetical protein